MGSACAYRRATWLTGGLARAGLGTTNSHSSRTAAAFRKAGRAGSDGGEASTRGSKNPADAWSCPSCVRDVGMSYSAPGASMSSGLTIRRRCALPPTQRQRPAAPSAASPGTPPGFALCARGEPGGMDARLAQRTRPRRRGDPSLPAQLLPTCWSPHTTLHKCSPHTARHIARAQSACRAPSTCFVLPRACAPGLGNPAPAPPPGLQAPAGRLQRRETRLCTHNLGALWAPCTRRSQARGTRRTM